jgi:solute carrier family 35 protein F5
MPILDMKFSWIKLFSICTAFGGITLVQLIDHRTQVTNPNENYLLGDIISLISAIMYAFYAIFLKKYVPDDSKFNWFGFFGVVGISVLVIFFHFLFVLDACGIEEFELPTSETFLYLLVNAIFGTVLSNYTWGRSVVLLNPLIAELGIGLTMPLGLIVDYFLEDKHYNIYYLLGSTYIMAGFVIVTLYDYYAEKAEEERKQVLSETFLFHSNRASIVIKYAPG